MNKIAMTALFLGIGMAGASFTVAAFLVSPLQGFGTLGGCLIAFGLVYNIMHEGDE